MDILTHTLSGVAIGTVVASFSNKGAREKGSLLIFAGFGGAFPDFDAISLWSQFDSTVGRICGLHHTGQDIYFSRFWYSHHGFFHSFVASLLFAFIIGILIYIVRVKFRESSVKNLLNTYGKYKLHLLGFILGFIIHLFEDMPTPGCVWGGIDLFWPSMNYIGGTGEIWWWNNYDIFLIVIAVIAVNGLIHVLKLFIPFDSRKITTLIFILGLTFSLFQIKTRGFDFSYTGHTSRYGVFELKSKEIQKHALGDELYNLMVRFDNALGINF